MQRVQRKARQSKAHRWGCEYGASIRGSPGASSQPLGVEAAPRHPRGSCIALQPRASTVWEGVPIRQLIIARHRRAAAAADVAGHLQQATAGVCGQGVVDRAV